jgi:hypothetical protein
MAGEACVVAGAGCRKLALVRQSVALLVGRDWNESSLMWVLKESYGGEIMLLAAIVTASTAAALFVLFSLAAAAMYDHPTGSPS